MINDVQGLRSALIQAGIAMEADLAGCSAGEIDALEQRYGTLPASYRQVLALIGHGAGRLVDRAEFWIYADQTGRIHEQVQAYLAEVRAEGGEVPDIPADAVFISARYGEWPHFVRAGSAPDAAVHVFNYDDESIAKAYDSVWDWIADFVADAQFFLALGSSRGTPPSDGGAGP
ncbi:MAG TPA: SMI1/KNR4 family protein [Longimicrobium sp.]|nr:SMI1/KNR4 family protein [Longimicrobium sp.]